MRKKMITSILMIFISFFLIACENKDSLLDEIMPNYLHEVHDKFSTDLNDLNVVGIEYEIFEFVLNENGETLYFTICIIFIEYIADQKTSVLVGQYRRYELNGEIEYSVHPMENSRDTYNEEVLYYSDVDGFDLGEQELVNQSRTSGVASSDQIHLWLTKAIDILNNSQKIPNNNFEIQIIADTGIELAIGNTNNTPISYPWVTTISSQTVNNYIKEMNENFLLNMVTSPDGVNFYTFGSTSSQTLPAFNGYLELPIHFRSNHASIIKIDNISLTSDTIQWQSDVAFTDSKGQEISAGQNLILDITNAIRLSFESNTSVVAFEKPESPTNSVLGYRHQTNLSSMTGSMSYYYVKSGMYPSGFENVSVVETITSISSNQVLTMTSNQTSTSGSDYYGYITLRIWIEGWDQEAYNAIFLDHFKLSLSFSG